jgi:gamma-glutamyltranspeptidase/glutathione hydrolase
MVATPHRLATEAGVTALRAGGNALDAAIAAAAAIAVVYGHTNGLGGDNFWLIHDAGHDAGAPARPPRLRALSGCGRAARAASIAWYAARGVTDALPARGGAAALTVPGAVDGWWQAHQASRAMGSPLAWPALLADAIRHARDGFSASVGQRTPPPREPDLFGETAPAVIRRSLWPLYHPDALARGPLVQPDLARTLEAVAAGGSDAFYRGDVAQRLVAAARAEGSPLAMEDLAAYRAEWMEPLRLPHHHGEVVSFPPPTQGVSALALLGIAQGFDLAALSEADYVHVLAEAAKLAFEDRDRHVTDPEAMTIAPAELLAPERLARLRARLTLGRALPVAAAGAAGGDTVAIVAADRAGHAVCVIQSVYFTYGSGLVAGDTGVVLQNRGSFFSLDPRHANALAPGKRTMHTLIPSMYLEGGRPRLVYGTMGGEGQPQTQAALLTRRLHRGLGVQAAIEAPRWLYGRTWGVATRALSVEGRFPADLARDLAARGHDVKVGGEWDDLFGHAQAVWIEPDGELVGGSDPRADGAALGL